MNKHTNNSPNTFTGKGEKGEEAFLAKVRQELDQSCNRLDGHTQSRLNSIRHAAVERGLERQPGRYGRVLLAPFGGLVTACVLVVVVSLFYQQQPGTPVPAIPDSRTAIEDLDILTATESLEFLENLEFYQWLEENEATI